MKTDPGKDKASREERKAARLKEWKREKVKKERKQAQDDRWAEWEAATGGRRP